MKKMMRRLIALIMVLNLCTGIIVLPVVAEEAEPQGQKEAITTVTVEIKDSTGAVIGEQTTTTTTSESGTTTSEKITTTATGDTGSVTEEQTTKTTTDSSGTVTGEGTSTSTTQVETAKTETGGTQTETDKTWESEETQYGPTTGGSMDDNVTQTTESNTQTVTEGSSENIDTVEREGNTTHYSGSETGEETTVITDTTTTTTTTTDDLLDTQTENPEVDPTFQEGTYGNPEVENISDWVRDPDNDVTDISWEKIPGTETTTTTTETGEVIPDPLAGNTDVTLQMTPGGTDRETATLSGADALKAVIPKEGKQADGSVVKYNYKNGVLIGYTVTRYGGEATEISDTIVEGTTTDMTRVSATEDVFVLPQDYTEGTETSSIQTQDGNTTIQTETVTTKLEDGSGYKIVTTEIVTTGTDSTQDPLNPGISTSPDDFYTAPIIPKNAAWISDDGDAYIQLPQQPEPSLTTEEDGTTTEVTVEKITDSVTGVVIGFRTTTKVTNPDGSLKSRHSTTEYGSITTFSSKMERDPDTKQVTTVTEKIVKGLQDTQTFQSTTSGTRDINITRVGQEDVYQLVDTGNGLVFIYNGIMHKVEGTSKLRASTEVATGSTVNMNTYVTGSHGGDLRLYGETLPNNTTSKVTDYYTGQLFKSKYHDDVQDGDWKHIGYGLFADFALKETDGTSHSAKQFMIQDGDEIRYVYCVELGAGIAAGSSYGSTKYSDTTSNNAKHPWNGADGTIGQIRSVALNGFWGTASGLGSLEAVKDLLRRNGYTAEADRLTAGMALTATQVAIWEFGAQDGGKFGGDGYNFVTWDDGTGAPPDKNTWKTIVTLRDLLVDLAKNPQKGQAEVIDKSDIKGGAITLKERVSEGKDGNDVYNTDLSFTLDVSTSSINGNLIVKVIVDGKEVGRARLAGNNDASLFKWGKIYPDANGTYTIKDVELAEGVTVDLQLTGTQHLDDGVYVFKGEGNKQDFVGLSKLEQDIDITVSMEFSVTEPDMTLKHTQKQWGEQKTDKQAYVRTNTLSNSRTGVQTDTTVTVTTDLYGTRTQTDVVTTVTKLQRDWERYYDYTVTDLSQRDDDVDPADPPKTGDTTLILALVSLFSGGGLVLMNRKKEEE